MSEAYVVVRDGCSCCEGGKSILYVANSKANAEAQVKAFEEVAKRAQTAYEEFNEHVYSKKVGDKVGDDLRHAFYSTLKSDLAAKYDVPIEWIKNDHRPFEIEEVECDEATVVYHRSWFGGI